MSKVQRFQDLLSEYFEKSIYKKDEDIFDLAYGLMQALEQFEP